MLLDVDERALQSEAKMTFINDNDSTSDCCINSLASTPSNVTNDNTYTESNDSPVTPNFSDILSDKTTDDVLDNSQTMIEETSFDTKKIILGFKLVGDNIDKNVKMRHMRQDKRTESMHYYHSCAVRDRTSISGLSDAVPNLKDVQLLSIPITRVLPSSCDQCNIKHNFTILVSRQIVGNFHYFKENYDDVVTAHIKHNFYNEMSQKSVTVS